jgi:hypothetical protein
METHWSLSMPDGQQQQKEARRDASHASDRHAALAELERTLQREPHTADEWCELGESYDALAANTADQRTAGAYREKAVAALTHAISLSPGLAKAHYALAGVYQAQDPCLALVELEAAARCDPQSYQPALVQAQKAVRDVFSCRESPANSQQEIAVPASVSPPRMQSGRSVVLPVSLMVVVFGGCLIAYLNLIAPSRTASSERAHAASESPKAPDASSKLIRESAEAAVAPAPEPAPALVAAALPRLASPAPTKSGPAAPAPEPQPATVSRPVEAPPTSSAAERATASIIAREVALAERAQPTKPALPRVERPAAPVVAAPEAAVGSVATQAATVELKPLLKEQPAVATRVQKEPVAPVQPSSSERLTVARSVPNEQSPAPRPVLKDHPVPAPALSTQSSANENSWTARMRADLAACGKPGFWRNDICRETTRWNYCHPNRWGSVPECVIERFASSGSPP